GRGWFRRGCRGEALAGGGGARAGWGGGGERWRGGGRRRPRGARASSAGWGRGPARPARRSPGCEPDLSAASAPARCGGAVGAVEYVLAGDCVQVSLQERLLRPAVLPSLELYRRLRERNPAPFAGYLDLGEFAVASASPERFLRVAGGEVQTRPIKGTRPRG